MAEHRELTPEERLSIVEYQLNGNGDPGLCERVRVIYDWVQRQMGKGEGNAEEQANTVLKTSKRANWIQIILVVIAAASLVGMVCSMYIAHKESVRGEAGQPTQSQSAPQDTRLPPGYHPQ